ncbi:MULTISPECIES: helix-turn-helix transcriptional regulator [unclassified Bradyrhizobium]|uniref:helix-turn-helix domain-containing protein n=1 Tax=unclassified Bradyrhizobium TaxID=2631580 RepID=UPI001CD2212E|nr:MULTISPECIES: helix-turn-helix transcriptional regulator [unclassified Bradyrhizobium]
MDTRSFRRLRPANPIGDLLRGWRTRRALSQAELAFEAGISVKHLSYVETGKAAASRDILLQLASALDLSLRDRNALLEAGGFARQYASAICRRRSLPRRGVPSTCCSAVTSRSRRSSPTGAGT